MVYMLYSKHYSFVFFLSVESIFHCFSLSVQLLLPFWGKWPYSCSTTAKITFSLSFPQIFKDAQRSVAPSVGHNFYCAKRSKISDWNLSMDAWRILIWKGAGLDISLFFFFYLAWHSFKLFFFCNMKPIFVLFFFLRLKRKPNKTPGCPKGLWVFGKGGQQWKNPLEPQVALTLSYERPGKYWLWSEIVYMTFFCNWTFGRVIIHFFLSHSQRVKCTSSLLSTWHKARDGRPRFPARFSSQSWKKVDWFFLFTSLNGYWVCQRVFLFSQAITIVLIVVLTFVTPSPRVQPSQQPAPPLWARLCVPGTVPLHGLLFQPTAPRLLLPHGWWVAFCVLHWHF